MDINNQKNIPSNSDFHKPLQNEILDSISCGVLSYSFYDKKFIFVNNAAKEILGFVDYDDPMKTINTFISQRVTEDDRRLVSDVKKHLKKNGDTLVQEYRIKTDGEIKYIHSTIKYLENAEGEPYILVTMLDTTEQARLTRIIEKERKAYRDALANGSEFSFLFDVTAGTINEEFITSHGVNLIKSLGFTVPVSFDALLSKYVDVCKIEFATDDMKKNFTRKALLDAFSNGTTNVVTEFYNPERDIFFRVNCLMSLDEDTGHIVASVVADDITKIRKQEQLQKEELRASYDEMNVRLNTILDGVSGGFKIADIDNNFRYTYISEGAAQLQGYTVDEFLEKFGKRVTSNIFEEDGEPALAEAMRQIMEKGSYAVKYRVPVKDGGIKWVIDRGKYVEDSKTGKKYLYILMQDVTELEERNMQLGDVLTMQKHMSDFLGNGIFAYTLPDREILLINQEARKMFDCMGSDKQSYGLDIISKIIPQDMPQVRAAVKNLVAPGDWAEYIFHSDSVAGERKTFKCNTRLLSFESGQKYILSAITDITEQEKAEIHLEEERRVYRDALVLGSSGVFTIDLTTGYVEKTVYTEQGENLMEKIGVSLPAKYDTFAKAWLSDKRIVSDSEQINIAHTAEGLISAFENGTSVLDIEYNVPEDGRYFHLIVLLYKSNDHNCATFIVYDVTSDRHTAKQRRNVINSLGKIYFALYHLSFRYNTCTLLKANSDILSQLSDKCELSVFYHTYINNYVEDEYKSVVKSFLDPENVKKALMHTDTTSIEFRRKNYGWCRVNLVAAERDKNNVVTSVVFANNVIEKQKQEELAKQKALEMAYDSANIANEAKTNFLANMSHDIRTPMNAIIGMTAIAGAHLDDRERLSDCLSKISISSKHLLGIINEVLDMSKIESGKIEMQEEEFNIENLVENLLAMLKTEIAAKNHQFSVFIDGINHKNVIGDSQRLQQVFMNLMSNAIKYTPSGGHIELALSEKQTNKPNIACYEITVKDNGIGMSEETIKHIFEPFSRATDDSRLDKIQGTGLGMSITKSILQMMNGDIQVESQWGKGTKFTATFFLSLNNESDDKEDKKVASSLDSFANEKFTSKRILLVEDNSLNAEIAGEILGMAGLEIEYATNGKEAVDIMTNIPDGYFDIIFMDVQMPVLNGYEATRAIRSLPSDYAKSVPIFAMTANAFAEDVTAAKNAGMNDHIAKPLDFDRLMQIIKKWLA